MIAFVLIAMIMLFYFELLGQSVNNILKVKNLPFNFVIGFFFVLSAGYLTSGILQFINVSFEIILIINLIILVFGLVIIAIKFKKITIYFKTYELLLLILLALFSLYFSYNTTLGDLHGFDSTFYINMVVGPLNSKGGLYSFSNTFGYIDNALAATGTYRFQTYYGFCSTVVWICKSVFELLGKDVFLSTIYIWVFQIIFVFSIISILLNSLKSFSKHQIGLCLSICVVFVFCYLKIYFFNVFGFYGNSFRVIAVSYLCFFATRIDNEKNSGDLYLLSLSLIAGCAFTSTFLFFVYIYMFGYVLANSKENEKLFKWTSIIFLMPTINLLTLMRLSLNVSFVISLIISTFLYFFNGILTRVIKAKYTVITIVFFASIIMFFMSYKVTNDVFDFSAFFESGSEFSDMTLNYFSFNSLKYFKLFMIVTMFLSMFLAPTEKNNLMAWILIMVLFNPFCCSYFKSINPVYYRTYDLILNPYLLIYYSKIIYKNINLKLVNVAGLIFSIVLLASTNIFRPLYYHASFMPQENYDHINKVINTEADMVREIRHFSRLNDLSNPFICSPNILTFSSLGYGRYIYGREYEVFGYEEHATQVHKIFRPVNYYGEEYYIPDGYLNIYNFEPDYKHAYDHLKNAGIDILVVSKDMDYYDEEKDVYYPIRNLVEWWYDYPDYENEDYCLYMINRK